MDLLALIDFNLVAKHGGFGRAARATKRPKATLSRHIAELESTLTVRLFERGGGIPRLTEEGRALHERTAGLLHELDEVVAGLFSSADQPKGRLKISAPQLFAQAAMGRLAAGFVVKQPGIQLEVVAEDRAVDMIEERYDLVIRVNPSPDQELIGRPFLRDRLVVVAAPTLRRPAEGEPAPAILLTTANADAPWRITRSRGTSEVALTPILRLSSLTMVRDAARTGVGAALLPLSMVSSDIKRGTFVRWGDSGERSVELWALYTSRRLLSRRVSAFLEYLGEAFPKGTSEELAALMETR